MLDHVSFRSRGGSTDFTGAMRGVLELLVGKQQVIKKTCVYCVTDMQFDAADVSGEFRTTIEVVHRNYKAAHMDVPLLLLHNARGVDACPFDPKLPGVICVSGFSTDMLKEIMVMLGTGDIKVPAAQGVSEAPVIEPDRRMELSTQDVFEELFARPIYAGYTFA